MSTISTYYKGDWVRVEDEASNVCKNLYGFDPEKISVMERNPDDE